MSKKRQVKIKKTASCIVVPLFFLTFPLINYACGDSLWDKGVWLAVVIGAMCVCLIYAWDNPRQKYLLESGEETKGSVKEVIFGKRLYKLKVEYVFKDVYYQSITKNLLNVWWPKFRSGQGLRIFVDPVHPESFVVYEASAYQIANG